MSGLGTSTQTSGGVTTTATQPFQPVIAPETSLVGQEQTIAQNPAFGETMTAADIGRYAQAQSNLGALIPNSFQGGQSAQTMGNSYLNGDPQGLIAQQRGNLSPVANANLDPTQTPGMQNVLKTIQNDVSNNINSQFAGAGRSLSGLNQQAIARGLSQGEAQPLLAQYNQNVQNMMGANQNLGTLQGQQISNLNAGAGLLGAVPGLETGIPQAQLGVSQQQRTQPYQTLGMQENILNPIAGLGGTVAGSGQLSGTQTASPLTQFGQANSSLGSGISGGLLGLGGFV